MIKFFKPKILTVGKVAITATPEIVLAPAPIHQKPGTQSLQLSARYCKNDTTPKPIGWGIEIKELEIFFADVHLSKQPVKLNKCSTITNLPLFIETHFTTIRANDGKKIFIPFLHRLRELKKVLTIN
jgi:hypothetical protein